ncbi:MAG: hypothetical protein ACJ76H_01400 [Bacteriovoracaceae bacterium]
MIRLFVLLVFVSFSAFAYVPTVESLFRHGSNPDVTANGVAFTMAIKKVMAGEQAQPPTGDQKTEDFFKVFLTKATGDNLKVAQARYKDNTFSEGSLEHKIYYSNFSPYTLKPSVEQMEKGVFYSLVHSLAFNNGSHIVNYLKTLGVPVKLNDDLINREKIEYLASYKRYLVTINQNKAAKKTEVNPLRPEDAAARERVEAVMNESMYVDTKQVKLIKDEGDMAWFADAGPFTAVFAYNSRDVLKVVFKSAAGELEIICRNYGMLNGTHRFPRTILVKDFKGDNYQIEVTDLRHYNEREEDIVRRLKKWDSILRGRESQLPRPAFLL